MKNLLTIFILILILSTVACAASLKVGTSESVAPENAPAMMEYYRIKIINTQNGSIEISRDEGKTWKKVGRVIAPTEMVSNTGYTASRWVADGQVAAVAVNAIHIKTDYNLADEKGVIFSILPRESYNPSPEQLKNNNSYLSPDSSIYTDIKAGYGIFGGDYSPFVGNNVLVQGKAGKLDVITKGYVPLIGQKIVIIVERPVRYPKEIVFENRFGGLISIKYNDGEQRYIGQVLRPVEGVGRFIGTQYCDVGRIRANHPGVIDISTSPLGRIGGFQILPATHGMSEEMKNARTMTQWMVIGPINALDPSYEGIGPFFRYYLQPKYDDADIDKKDWEGALLERFLVEVKYKGKDEWQPMPVYYFDPDMSKPLPKWSGTALEDISHIRILFPVYRTF